MNTTSEYAIPKHLKAGFARAFQLTFMLVFLLSTGLLHAQATQKASVATEREAAKEALLLFAKLMDQTDEAASKRLVPPDLANASQYSSFLMALANFQKETSSLRTAAVERYGKQAIVNSKMFQSALPESGLISLIDQGQWLRSNEGWVVMIPHGGRQIQVPLKQVNGRWYLKVEQMTLPLGGVSHATQLFEMMARVMNDGGPLLKQHEALIDFHKALNALTRQRMSAFQAQAMARIKEEQQARDERFFAEFPLKFTQTPTPQDTSAKVMAEIQQAFKLGQAQQFMKLFKAESVEARKTRLFYGVLVTLAWDFDRLRFAVKEKWGDQALKQLDHWDTMARRAHLFKDQLNEAKIIREARVKSATFRAYVVGPANEPLLILIKTDPEGWFINGESLSKGLQHVEVEMTMLYKLSVVYGLMAQVARGDQFKSFDQFFVALKMRSTEAIAPHVAELARLRRGSSESKP